MSEIYFISDLHLFHDNILKFKTDEGEPLRDFTDIHAMHACIMENWCRYVKPQDKIYVLGDVAFKPEGLDLLKALPGHKRLVKGNHDLFKPARYLEVFEEVYGAKHLEGYWLTHIPIHPNVLEGRAKGNIHGHVHYRTYDDRRYFNACVENTGYTPVHFEFVRQEINNELSKSGNISPS